MMDIGKAITEMASKHLDAESHAIEVVLLRLLALGVEAERVTVDRIEAGGTFPDRVVTVDGAEVWRGTWVQVSQYSWALRTKWLIDPERLSGKAN